MINRSKYIIIVLISILLNCNRNKAPKPHMYYYPKKNLLTIIDKSTKLNEIVYVFQDTSNQSDTIEIKQATFGSYIFNNKKIINRDVILSFKCTKGDGEYEFYDLYIGKLNWQDSILLVFESLPN